MNNIKVSIKTQEAIMKYFLTTSIPRILKECKNPV